MVAKSKKVAPLRKDIYLISSRILLLVSLVLLTISYTMPGWGTLLILLYLLPFAVLLYSPYALIKSLSKKGSISRLEMVLASAIFILGLAYPIYWNVAPYITHFRTQQINRQDEAINTRIVEGKIEGCRSVYDFKKDSEVSMYEKYYSHFGPIEQAYEAQMSTVKKASDDCYDKKISGDEMMRSWIDAKRNIEQLAIAHGGQSNFDTVNKAANDQSNCTDNGKPCVVLLIENTDDFFSRTQ